MHASNKFSFIKASLIFILTICLAVLWLLSISVLLAWPFKLYANQHTWFFVSRPVASMLMLTILAVFLFRYACHLFVIAFPNINLGLNRSYIKELHNSTSGRCLARLILPTIIIIILDMAHYSVVDQDGVTYRTWGSIYTHRVIWDDVSHIEAACLYFDGKNSGPKFIYNIAFTNGHLVNLFALALDEYRTHISANTFLGYTPNFEHMRYIDQVLIEKSKPFRSVIRKNDKRCIESAMRQFGQDYPLALKLMRVENSE